ncbi:GNAT family N-acetyltransferase [Rhizobium paknamense]|uniref:Phosphinothricin acetyltransferase n=1 Tax=Rhizobium paknamense TaxID=1206817 RepID=A0ABU0IIU4_9HYPH|nr:GNAT family N-acetyltransferase [Rhizobium paknamense]MDQ0457340.1 phosphinothricin acetyltransferase [Rhizobium paknamense]
MTLSLRPASFADIPAITAIYAQAVTGGTACYELEPPDEAEMRRRMEAILAGKFPYLIAEEGGEVLGYAYASFFRTRAAYRFLVEDSIYLGEAARGRGVGKLLLTALIEQCTALGYRQMIAVIGGASPASIGLHRSLGFVHSGGITGSGFKFGHWLDTVFMQRPLGEGKDSLPE